MIIREARSARILLLIPANQFVPDAMSLLKNIQDRVKHMFIEPEKYILVGITKLKFCQNIFGRKRLMKTASGESG